MNVISLIPHPVYVMDIVPSTMPSTLVSTLCATEALGLSINQSHCPSEASSLEEEADSLGSRAF